MASRDMHGNVSAVAAVVTTAKTDNTATEGAIIDTHGFDSAEFVILAGALTSGSIVPSVVAGNAADLSDGEAAAAAELLGTVAGATVAKVGSTDDSNKAKRLGYRGSKRYVRLVETGAGTQASGTATIGAGLAADEKVTIEGHDFVFKAAPSAADEVLLGADEAESAANLAAAINASETEGIAGVVTASAAAAVVTITAVAAGTGGNALTLAKTGAHLTVSGSGTLAGAVDCVGTVSAVCILGHPRLAPVA